MIGVFATMAIALSATARGDDPEPQLGRYKAHVATLASSEYAGRRGAGGVKAATYVGRELKALGLEPGFGGDYVQDVPAADGRGVIGHNVAAKLEGSDPAQSDEWIIIGAHFDHLGRSGSDYYPGADDNASGVAMMLEIARCMAAAEARPRRSVLFVGFDLEEYGLLGSRYFVEHPPMPLAKIKLFVTADMIGRSLGGVCDGLVFVFGTQTSPSLKRFVDEAAARQPIRLATLGNDVLIIDRSDYGPFRGHSIPYLFFSTGENPCYHQRTDTSDTLDYDTALAATRVVFGVIRRAASAPDLKPWNGTTQPTLGEALAVRDVLRTMQANHEKLAISAAGSFVLRTTLANLDGIVARGAITPGERARLVRAARFLMATVL